MKLPIVVIAAFCAGAAAAAEGQAPYAGQEGRAIAALSEADVAALRAGEGWGLAKPAELNGWPGPRHVLDLAEELGLTEAQRAATQTIFDAMAEEARARGADYIAAEAKLDAAFAEAAPGEGPDAAALAALTVEAGEALARLRAAHLEAHLATAPLLSGRQRTLYARLRGYDAGDGGHGAHGGHGG